MDEGEDEILESIRSIPAGTELFHGTSGKEKFRIPTGPAFFSDSRSVARYFSTWHDGSRPRILRYEVTREVPRLVLIESAQDFDRFADSQGTEVGDSTEERIELVCRSGFDGWIIPSNYPDGADIMICDPDRWVKYLDEERVRA